MKKVAIFILLMATMVTISSCDHLRSLVGLPTSQELAAAAEAERVRVQDSLKEVQLQKAYEDSVKAAEAAAAAELAREAQLLSSKRFHVIAGSFLNYENSSRMEGYFKEKGYQPLKITFKNGFEAVSVKGFDRLTPAYELKMDLISFGLAPEDCWIYDLRQKLHKE